MAKSSSSCTRSQFNICEQELISIEEVLIIQCIVTIESCGIVQGFEKYSCKTLCNNKKHTCF